MGPRIRNAGGATCMAMFVAACGNGLGPGEAAQVDVTLAQTGSVSAQVTGWYASVGQSGGVYVDVDDVASLHVTVADIEFLPADQAANAGDPGAWISLQLAVPVTLDLAGLPTQDLSPLRVASGTLAGGMYNDVRLLVSSADIVFNVGVDLGVAFAFEGGVEYTVSIPSGMQTGIKTDLTFAVDDTQEEVNLVFDAAATFLNVSGTGMGEVTLSPVIR